MGMTNDEDRFLEYIRANLPNLPNPTSCATEAERLRGLLYYLLEGATVRVYHGDMGICVERYLDHDDPALGQLLEFCEPEDDRGQ